MKKFKKGQIIQLEVEKIAYGGKAIAKSEGMVVFVDQAVPGDIVTVRIAKAKKGYAEARRISLDIPSPDRSKPPCRYAEICGGCKWQGLAYEKQLDYKRSFVKESVEHIGLINDVVIHPTLPADRLFGYRNKMEFSCCDRRWLMPEEMDQPQPDRDFVLGLHAPGTFFRIIDIHECLLMPEAGNGILSDLRQYMKESGVPAYNLRAHTGFWRFVVLRHSFTEDRWMANIITAGENPKILASIAERLAKNHPEVLSIQNNVTTKKSNIAFGDYEINLFGPSVLKDRIGSLEFEISANSFFQTNTKGAEQLYTVVKEYASLTGRETVLDLYCGTGTISIFLAGLTKEIIGLEIVESAVSDAERNRQLNRIENCRFIAGDIRESLPQMPTPDVVIVDPPRAGLHPDTVHTLLKMKPERIVYVSCNPSTLARDLNMLKRGYIPLEIQPVDLFPHTWHIESVARLERVKKCEKIINGSSEA